MTETFASALERLRDVARGQAVGYRRLREATREGTDALRRQDAPRFERLLEDQLETLRELKSLERERGQAMRDVGATSGDATMDALDRELKALAADVLRENRLRTTVTSRLDRVGETRVGFHRRAGTLPADGSRALDERA